MRVSTEKLPKSRVKFTIELTADEVQPHIETAARELSKEHPVKGFRPGSVPVDVIRSAVGDQTLVERTLQHLVPKTYVEALLEREDVEAIGRPEVTARQIILGKTWVYEATVAVLPDVELGDYRRLTGERRAQNVDLAEVDREIEILRKMRASFITVPRHAQHGDRVEVDIRAAVANVPLEDGSAQHQPLLLGESQLVPGFEEHILGMKEGETKTFAITFPEKHHQFHLRGRAVDFTVTVKLIQQRILPTLDDDFAKRLGQFSSLADLREKLTKNILVEKEEREEQRFRQMLLDQVVKTTRFSEIPDVLVERELDKMLSELEGGLEGTGLSLDAYFQQVQKTREEVRAGFRAQAIERIRAGLTLRALAKAERIEASDEEVQEEVKKALQQFPSVEAAEKHVDLEELTRVAAGTIRNRKVFAHLEELSKGKR